jgi:putative nucleotidyltransferase with HDIG domain
MPQEIRERTRTTPRAILLTAMESASVAGGADQLITRMWTHSVLVARIARDLAPVVDVDPTDAVAAGLLHDVGAVLLLGRHPSAYLVVSDVRRPPKEQLAVEESAFGVDHALLGAEHLLDRRMPDVIADAVADHHDPIATSAATTLVVAAADEIAHVDRARRRALDLLGIAPEAAALILRSAVGDPTDDVVATDRDRSLTQ